MYPEEKKSKEKTVHPLLRNHQCIIDEVLRARAVENEATQPARYMEIVLNANVQWSHHASHNQNQENIQNINHNAQTISTLLYPDFTDTSPIFFRSYGLDIPQFLSDSKSGICNISNHALELLVSYYMIYFQCTKYQALCMSFALLKETDLSSLPNQLFHLCRLEIKPGQYGLILDAQNPFEVNTKQQLLEHIQDPNNTQPQGAVYFHLEKKASEKNHVIDFKTMDGPQYQCMLHFMQLATDSGNYSVQEKDTAYIQLNEKWFHEFFDCYEQIKTKWPMWSEKIKWAPDSLPIVYSPKQIVSAYELMYKKSDELHTKQVEHGFVQVSPTRCTTIGTVLGLGNECDHLCDFGFVPLQNDAAYSEITEIQMNQKGLVSCTCPDRMKDQLGVESVKPEIELYACFFNVARGVHPLVLATLHGMLSQTANKSCTDKTQKLSISLYLARWLTGENAVEHPSLINQIRIFLTDLNHSVVLREQLKQKPIEYNKPNDFKQLFLEEKKNFSKKMPPDELIQLLVHLKAYHAQKPLEPVQIQDHTQKVIDEYIMPYVQKLFGISDWLVDLIRPKLRDTIRKAIAADPDLTTMFQNPAALARQAERLEKMLKEMIQGIDQKCLPFISRMIDQLKKNVVDPTFYPSLRQEILKIPVPDCSSFWLLYGLNKTNSDEFNTLCSDLSTHSDALYYFSRWNYDLFLRDPTLCASLFRSSSDSFKNEFKNQDASDQKKTNLFLALKCVYSITGERNLSPCTDLFLTFSDVTLKNVKEILEKIALHAEKSHTTVALKNIQQFLQSDLRYADWLIRLNDPQDAHAMDLIVHFLEYRAANPNAPHVQEIESVFLHLRSALSQDDWKKLFCALQNSDGVQLQRIKDLVASNRTQSFLNTYTNDVSHALRTVDRQSIDPCDQYLKPNVNMYEMQFWCAPELIESNRLMHETFQNYFTEDFLKSYAHAFDIQNHLHSMQRVDQGRFLSLEETTHIEQFAQKVKNYIPSLLLCTTKQLQEKLNGADNPSCSDEERLAIIQVLILRHSSKPDRMGYFLRSTQLLALIYNILHKNDSFIQNAIQTGEGKSLVIAALSIFRATKNQKEYIDLILTDEALVQQHIDKEGALYQSAGVPLNFISLSPLCDGRYINMQSISKKPGVNIGTALNHLSANCQSNDPLKSFVILDECDYLLKNAVPLIASSEQSLKVDESLFDALIEYIDTHHKMLDDSQQSLKINLVDLHTVLKTKNIQSVFVRQLASCIQSKSDSIESVADAQFCSDVYNILHAVCTTRALVQLPEEERPYRIVNNRLIPYADKKPRPELSFCGWVQPFLCLYINRERKAKNLHALPIAPSLVSTHVHTILSYLKKFATGCCALTGSPSLMNVAGLPLTEFDPTQIHAHTIHVPPFRPSQRIDQVRLVETKSDRNLEVVRILNQLHGANPRRNVVVHVSSEEAGKELNDCLAQQKLDWKVHTFFGSVKSTDIERAGELQEQVDWINIPSEEPKILITQVADRGVDFHQIDVIDLSFLPFRSGAENAATHWIQALGRAGRAGHAGHAFSVISKEDVHPVLYRGNPPITQSYLNELLKKKDAGNLLLHMLRHTMAYTNAPEAKKLFLHVCISELMCAVDHWSCQNRWTPEQRNKGVFAVLKMQQDLQTHSDDIQKIDETIQHMVKQLNRLETNNAFQLPDCFQNLIRPDPNPIRQWFDFYSHYSGSCVLDSQHLERLKQRLMNRIGRLHPKADELNGATSLRQLIVIAARHRGNYFFRKTGWHVFYRHARTLNMVCDEFQKMIEHEEIPKETVLRLGLPCAFNTQDLLHYALENNALYIAKNTSLYKNYRKRHLIAVRNLSNPSAIQDKKPSWCLEYVHQGMMRSLTHNGDTEKSKAFCFNQLSLEQKKDMIQFLKNRNSDPQCAGFHAWIKETIHNPHTLYSEWCHDLFFKDSPCGAHDSEKKIDWFHEQQSPQAQETNQSGSFSPRCTILESLNTQLKWYFENHLLLQPAMDEKKFLLCVVESAINEIKNEEQQSLFCTQIQTSALPGIKQLKETLKQHRHPCVRLFHETRSYEQFLHITSHKAKDPKHSVSFA